MNHIIAESLINQFQLCCYSIRFYIRLLNDLILGIESIPFLAISFSTIFLNSK